MWALPATHYNHNLHTTTFHCLLLYLPAYKALISACIHNTAIYACLLLVMVLCQKRRLGEEKVCHYHATAYVI
jgi:hypothetical protein